MGKKIYTTYVDVVLRCGSTTSGPVVAFEFDHTEDAVHFAADLLGRLDTLLLTAEETCGAHYGHTMRDYITIHIDCCHTYDFDNIWPAVSNVCQIFQAFERSATGSTVVEFPYGTRRDEMGFVEDTINSILDRPSDLIAPAYGVEYVGHNRFEIEGTTFVIVKVFGDVLIQEYGTQLYLDVRQRRAFQVAGGREVGLTAYEAFGVYPQNRRAVKNWLRKALTVAMYVSAIHEVIGGVDETL